MNTRQKIKYKFFLIIFFALLLGLVSYPKAISFYPPAYRVLNKLKINLGLDLQGGIHLVYQADLSQIDASKVDNAMQAVQDAIERKVNIFGVTEPNIYTTRSGSDRRIIVDLAGVKDANEAKKIIGDMPFLEFKEEGQEDESQKIPQELLDKMNIEGKKKAEEVLKKALAGEDFAQLAKENSQDPGSKDKGGEYDFVKKGSFVPEYEAVIFEKNLKNGEIYPELVETQFGWHIIKKIEVRVEGDNQEFKSAHILIAKQANPEIPQKKYVSTGLTGKNLKDAYVDSQQQGLAKSEIILVFDDAGTKIFADLTKKNIGKTIAIYIDDVLITSPVVQSEIPNGRATITGDYSIQEANNLARRLREGALPVPIKLIDQKSVDASLGKMSFEKSLKAGVIGLALVIVFMLINYRFLGIVASLALLIYAGLMVSILKLSGSFKAFQITLTLPGIAGFILSIGMAVDANVLIFERIKEEIRRGRNIMGAIEEGFKRAWTSIRDGNVSSIITALVLINMGTGFVKGFAVTLVIGVLVSMFTAVVITRTLLRFILGGWAEDKLWLIGVKKKDI